VNVRLLHAKEPGPIFQKDFDKYPLLARDLERAICPRIHFKLFIFDLETVYIGSANLTGAGIGMKSVNKRNFEAGILSNDKDIVNSAIEQFDLVWQGSFCKSCERKDYCKDRIDKF
jgi:phosphatidylserine/phosphatidylglycerophosphate/cardiolipin synthase-like enzyme